MNKKQDYAWRDHPIMFMLGAAAYTGVHLPKIVVDGYKEIHEENKREKPVNRHMKAVERYLKTALAEGRLTENEAMEWRTRELSWAVNTFKA